MTAAVQNWFATIALVFWPVFVFWLVLRIRPLGRAIIWAVLGAQLLLPEQALIKLAPGIPVLDKISIANLAVVGCLLFYPRRVRLSHGFGLVEILLMMSIISPFITSELNGDSVIIGRTYLPSIGHYEALSAVVRQLILLIPFFIGRRFLRTAEDNVEIFRVLVIAWLLYSIPILFEIRFSPQLHNWVYGYFPTDFLQEVRDGSYRPMVFMGHGLLAAFFSMMAAVSSAALWRAKIVVFRLPSGGITAYLSVLLALCHSAGAAVYGAILIPLVRWATPRVQMCMALFLVSVALFYPILRTADLIPTDSIINVASSISPERSGSLKMRFDQEKMLLTRASERFLFGWGRFGRSRVYEEDMGRDISVTDGEWIIALGQFGLFGFLAEFGLLVWPVFRAFSVYRVAGTREEAFFIAALALILSVNIIDLVPNSSLRPWTWLISGALLGRAESIKEVQKRSRSIIQSGIQRPIVN